MASLLQAQNIQISGVVLDEAEEPLPGVSIQVKGTQRGTSSGVNGDFAIKAGPRATLVFSFIGYERREIEAGENSVYNWNRQSTNWSRWK